MLQVIKQETLIALCEEAGVDPVYVSEAYVRHDHVSFRMYSQDSWGNKYIDKVTKQVKTHWITSKVEYGDG